MNHQSWSIKKLMFLTAVDLLQDAAALEDADQAKDPQHPYAFAQAQCADA